MSALEPGLYRATVRGVADQVVMVGKNGDYARIVSADTTLMAFQDSPKDITDARPLIVLDLADYDAGYVIEVLRHPHHLWANRVADQIEAQIKPARIPEPGLWGVVEASSAQWVQRDQYVRVRTDGNGDWRFSGGAVNWGDLIDPTLIREGIR